MLGEDIKEMSCSRYQCMLFIEMGSAVNGLCQVVVIPHDRLDTLRICDSTSMPPSVST